MTFDTRYCPCLQGSNQRRQLTLEECVSNMITNGGGTKSFTPDKRNALISQILRDFDTTEEEVNKIVKEYLNEDK